MVGGGGVKIGVSRFRVRAVKGAMISCCRMDGDSRFRVRAVIGARGIFSWVGTMLWHSSRGKVNVHGSTGACMTESETLMLSFWSSIIVQTSSSSGSAFKSNRQTGVLP